MSGKMTKQFKTAIINKLKNINIPGWVKYIATDKNGDVCGYGRKPGIVSKSGHWNIIESQDKSELVYLFKTDFDSTNWKNTLIELKPEVRSIEGKCIVIPSQPKSILRFKVWQPADTFLVYQILEAKNIPDDTNYEYTSVTMEYDLLHPETVVKNYESVEMFTSKEDRYAYINKMTKNLKELFSKDKKVKAKATEKDIGKNVETDCGVAELVAVTTDGKYVVTFKHTGSELFLIDNAWFNIKSDCDFNIIAIPGSAAEYYFAR